jgi:hypothetical protein
VPVSTAYQSTAGTTTSCRIGTTPAFMPLIGTKVNAKAAGHRHPRVRTARMRHRTCHGRNASGRVMANVSPATSV